MGVGSLTYGSLGCRSSRRPSPIKATVVMPSHITSNAISKPGSAIPKVPTVAKPLSMPSAIATPPAHFAGPIWWLPLISLSIDYVAIENIVTRELRPWRLVLVFMFGLLHGLGFAGVLR